MTPGRRCPGERCSVILTNGERYCPAHARAYEARRGTSTARGYGAAHKAIRAAWQARIDAGERIHCHKCDTPITGRDWQLDHTDDRRSYRGPSCVTCNTSDGGSKGAAISNFER